jgi:hypothetical protein
MKIEIISIEPNDTQIHDVGLAVGQQFDIRNTWKDKNSALDHGEVQVDSPDGKGLIVLNANEYKVI